MVLMGGAESYRNAGEAPGVEGLDPLYPVPARLATLLSECWCFVLRWKLRVLRTCCLPSCRLIGARLERRELARAGWPLRPPGPG